MSLRMGDCEFKLDVFPSQGRTLYARLDEPYKHQDRKVGPGLVKEDCWCMCRIVKVLFVIIGKN